MGKNKTSVSTVKPAGGIPTNERTPLLNPQPCDRASTPVEEVEDAENYTLDEAKGSPTIAIISLMLGVAVAQLGISLALTMHPTIASEFDCLSESSWLITTYALAMAAAQPLVGKLSDLFTRKSVLLSSYMMFSLGCVLCAIAPTFKLVLVGRVISGIGGAGMSALVAIIITDLVPLRDVGPWRGYVNLVGTMSRSLGGPIGGYLADTIGWRWSFTGQVPILIVAATLAAILLPTTSKQCREDKVNSTPDSQPPTQLERLAGIDFLGATLLTLAIIGFMLPLAAASKTGGYVLTVVLLCASTILLAGFVFVEHRYAKDPILHPTIMRNKGAMASYAALAFQAAAHIGLMFSVPIHFQVAHGASASAAGLQLVPAVVGSALGGILTGNYTKKFGKYKRPIVIGICLSGCSNVLVLFFWRSNLSPLKSSFIFPGGFGAGTVGSATYIAVTAVLSPEFYAVATACQYLAQSVGQVGGLAGAGALTQSVLRKQLETTLSDESDAASLINRIVNNAHTIDGLRPDLRNAVLECYNLSLSYCHGLSVTLNIIALAFTIWIQERRIDG